MLLPERLAQATWIGFVVYFVVRIGQGWSESIA